MSTPKETPSSAPASTLKWKRIAEPSQPEMHEASPREGLRFLIVCTGQEWGAVVTTGIAYKYIFTLAEGCATQDDAKDRCEQDWNAR